MQYMPARAYGRWMAFSPPADRFPMRISIVDIALVAGANSCNGKPDFGFVFRWLAARTPSNGKPDFYSFSGTTVAYSSLITVEYLANNSSIFFSVLCWKIKPM